MVDDDHLKGYLFKPNDIEMKLLRNGTTRLSRTATLVSRNESASLGHLYYMHFRSCLITRAVENSKGLVM